MEHDHSNDKRESLEDGNNSSNFSEDFNESLAETPNKLVSNSDELPNHDISSNDFAEHRSHLFENNIDNTFDDCCENYFSEELSKASILLELQQQGIQDDTDAKEKNIQCVVYNELAKEPEFTLMNMLKTDDHLKTFTEVNCILLKNLKESIIRCEIKPRQCKCSIETRIVLCLCKLKLNLSFKCLSVLFNLNRETCSNIFLITLHSLAFILEKAIYWPTKDEILKCLPKCFEKFKDTYTVLDCTEIPVERSQCLHCRLRLYSHYKGTETFKFLIGVAPSGLIMYLSKPFGGRASEKAIFNQSDILDKLVPLRDAIMVDKGFAIKEECLMAHIKLIMLPKLSEQVRFSGADVTSTKEVASAPVHVERSIQRAKLFNIFKFKISAAMAPYFKEISKVVCGIVNLTIPILADDKF